MIKISKTFEICDPESTEMGVFASTAFVYRDASFEFRELVHELKEYYEVSSPADERCWASTGFENLNFSTCDLRPYGPNVKEHACVEAYCDALTINHSLHFSDVERKRKYWVKALKARGLIE